MKVPPKRKGNDGVGDRVGDVVQRLNESPSEKEGKSRASISSRALDRLNESPSEKEGKSALQGRKKKARIASMKVPPKRKGNYAALSGVDGNTTPQ